MMPSRSARRRDGPRRHVGSLAVVVVAVVVAAAVVVLVVVVLVVVTAGRPPRPATSSTSSLPAGSTTTSSTAASAPSPAFVTDSFGRNVTGGWGSADVGGQWVLEKGSATDVSVNGSHGMFAIRAGKYVDAEQILVLPTTTALTYQGTFDVSFLDNVNAPNPQYGGVLAYLVARFHDTGPNGYYRMGVAWDAATRRLWLRTQNPAGKGATGDFTIELNTGIDPTADFPSGPPYGPYRVEVRITGTSPTTFASKIWKVGAPAPSGWMLTGSDTKGLGPQTAGPIGFRASNDLQGAPGAYLAFTAHLSIDNVDVGPVGP